MASLSFKSHRTGRRFGMSQGLSISALVPSALLAQANPIDGLDSYLTTRIEIDRSFAGVDPP